MHILTVVHENDSITRLAIGASSAAKATTEVLMALGYTVVVGFGDKPERDRDELDRLNGVLEDIHNELVLKTGKDIPKPPRF